MKFHASVENISLERSLSQNVDIGPGFYFMPKNGKIFVIFRGPGRGGGVGGVGRPPLFGGKFDTFPI